MQNLASTLEVEFGRGFSYRQLAFCRQFYRTYTKEDASKVIAYQLKKLITMNERSHNYERTQS
ncbi:hypothetical protein [Parabacteroides sp. Marseille-P3160]|uniref:hypothetical protein n=1 Tax=Parabacteroides sp. Marseille-P3160 TaxID=1917887 RepID=UPI00350ED589